MPEEQYRRRSARVLLVNGAGQLLLFRFGRDADHCWIAPGGGVEEGESLSEAAARELREETGMRVTPAELGSPVAVTSGYAELGWAAGTFRDDFFFLRTDGHEVDTGALTAFEQRERHDHVHHPSARRSLVPSGAARVAARTGAAAGAGRAATLADVQRHHAALDGRAGRRDAPDGAGRAVGGDLLR